jgi:hypothetical protein
MLEKIKNERRKEELMNDAINYFTRAFKYLKEWFL